MYKNCLIFCSLVFLAASCNQSTMTLYNDGFVELVGKKLNVQVADEPLEQELGLSGRASIDENSGMLFLFNESQKAAFWMKGMLFPIDIIWIHNNTVVDLSLSVPPQPGILDSQLEIYHPKTNVDSVLEVQAGWASENNLAIGDEVKFKLNE